MEKIIPFIIFLFLGTLLGATSCTSVSPGHVGIVSHMGAIQPYVLQEGVNFTRPSPLASVAEIDTRLRTVKEEAHSASQDLQSVTAVVTVQYSIRASTAPVLVQRFGYEDSVEDNILEPAIQESVKVVTARYTAEQLITRRDAVKIAIVQEIQHFVDATLRDRGVVGAIRLANVSVRDFAFSKEFNEAIEQKVRAEQDALKAKNEKEKRVTQAEAAAQEARLQADASAYSTEVQSKAKADAIERESRALQSNPGLIQLRTVDKWNGQLPTYTGGGALPLLKVN